MLSRSTRRTRSAVSGPEDSWLITADTSGSISVFDAFRDLRLGWVEALRMCAQVVGEGGPSDFEDCPQRQWAAVDEHLLDSPKGTQYAIGVYEQLHTSRIGFEEVGEADQIMFRRVLYARLREHDGGVTEQLLFWVGSLISAASVATLINCASV